MIYLDEDALICDFAETYNIYNYQALSPIMAGVLACGLRADSRIKMKMTDQSIDINTMLNAVIADRLAILIWQRTKDGQDGVNFPDSILRDLLNEKKESDHMVFDNGAEFDAYREKIINGK